MRWIHALKLPPEITEFERRYLQRANRGTLAFFAAHIPVITLIAFSNGTGAALAFGLTTFVFVGPLVASYALDNPRSLSTVLGVAGVFFGGLLVHFGQGPVQIEMHFYFFVLLAALIVFGNPMAILAAAVTVVLHHAAVWAVLPRSVFNHDAAWWVIAVHAIFVAVEATVACTVARGFFNNVIGFERVLNDRTAELAEKNADMRFLLDNVSQGFATIDAGGHLARKRSAAFDRWFDSPPAGASWFDCLERLAPTFASASRLGWVEVTAGIMPLALTVEQMPHRFCVGAVHYRVGYHPIGAGETAERYLVVVTDVTTEVEREEAASQRNEAMEIFDRVLTDRTGVASFVEEASEVIESLRAPDTSLAVVQRGLHTLKGNAAIFGAASVAAICHALEDHIAATGEAPNAEQIERISVAWSRLARDIERMMGRRDVIEIDEEQYAALVASVRETPGATTALWRLRELRLEPSRRRLRHFAEQARRVAEQLEKPGLEVHVEDHEVRLDARRWKGFWSAFVHAIRNAVDHGIEAPDERVALGKAPHGRLWLRTRQESGRVVIEVEDDGRGVDWARVRDKARAMGVACETLDDLQRALFEEKLSTAAEVSEVSGRGVGMGALREATRALGGEVTVTSTHGGGTKVRMVFPLSASRTLESVAPAAA
jgi:two-component system chemotaxis sensor kinase CheA